MKMHEIVVNMIGRISPVGETNEDNKRHENLKETIELVDRLVFDISQVAKRKNAPEFSIMRAGQKAQKFLEGLRDAIE